MNTKEQLEKEEEWWVKLWEESHRAYDVELVEDVLGLIIEEAKRRGAQEAWKEAKKIIETLKPKDPGGVGKGADKKYWWDHGWDVGARNLCIYASKEINAKLESLNKPVTGK